MDFWSGIKANSNLIFNENWKLRRSRGESQLRLFWGPNTKYWECYHIIRKLSDAAYFTGKTSRIGVIPICSLSDVVSSGAKENGNSPARENSPILVWQRSKIYLCWNFNDWVLKINFNLYLWKKNLVGWPLPKLFWHSGKRLRHIWLFRLCTWRVQTLMFKFSSVCVCVCMLARACVRVFRSVEPYFRKKYITVFSFRYEIPNQLGFSWGPRHW